MAEATTRAVTAGAGDDGLRLDRLLARELAELSRARLQALIKTGEVSGARGTIGDPGHKVKAGDTFLVRLPEPAAPEPLPEAIPLTVVYEDAHVIVIDKPAGLVVHPAAGHAAGTLVNALIAHCGDSLSGIGGVKRPGIVHRLDKDTTGLMVVAKSDLAHQHLSEQFAAHGRDGRMSRAYLAVVWGVPVPRAGRIEAALGRKASDRTRMSVLQSGGRQAVTHYEVIESYQDAEGEPAVSLVRCVLETGRTHQIRVHLAWVGHPLLGDPTYGSGFRTRVHKLREPVQAALAALDRQALHAAELGFEHPASGKPMPFASAPPADLQALLDALSTRPAPAKPKKSAKIRKRSP